MEKRSNLISTLAQYPTLANDLAESKAGTIHELCETISQIAVYKTLLKLADSVTSFSNTSETESTARGIQRSRGEAEKEAQTGNSVSGTGTESENNAGSQRDVSAYDAGTTWQPREKQTDDGSTSGSGTGYAVNAASTDRDRTENEVTQEGTSREGGTQTTTAGVEQTTHTAHLYGNIGVTTSTQLLEDFLRVERFNIYEQIADIFADEFAIQVY